jgi:hypothetical protein
MTTFEIGILSYLTIWAIAMIVGGYVGIIYSTKDSSGD